jgi:hypothetical protein
VKHRKLTITVLAGLGVYLALFYAVRLPTIEQVTGHTFRRVDYWQFLLLPEMLLSVWFGDPAEFALLDRLPVLGLAALIVAYSAALGWLLLAALRMDRALTRLEAFVFATAVGLATVSTYTLAAGLLGWLRNPMAFALPAVLSMAAFSNLWLRRAAERETQADQQESSLRRQRSPSRKVATAEDRAPADWLDARWLWLAAPFLAVIVLGGALPPVDFDVREYHLQAPKEFFGNGRVGFLPHNVYANMPLGSSMFALLAMSITGNWWLGALVGKTVIALTAPLTALAILAAGRRLHSNSAGIVGAVLYLGTPWVTDVATAGLAESPLAMYSFLAIYAGVLLPTMRTNVVLAGYLAGAAAACKYPAVLFVVLPLLGWTAFGRGEAYDSPDGGRSQDPSGGKGWFDRFYVGLRSRWKPVAALLCAAALGGGLWYVKNWFFTGNPTYPLLFKVFGDSTGTWTPASNAQWDRVHYPEVVSVAALARDLGRVFLTSEWLSPLLFPLGLLAVAARRPRRTELVLVGYFAWFIVCWWLLTHRIDRFWIPSLAVVAVLAGIGVSWSDRVLWRRAFLVLFAATSLASLLVAASPAPGKYQRFFLPLQRARTDPLRVDAWHRHFNAHPPEGVLLLVGDAAVFDLDVPILYSTCFDATPLRILAGAASPEERRRRLAEAGVSHVLVHWGEIARYRATYGFDPWVQPALFDELAAQEVLLPLPPIENHSARAYRAVPPQVPPAR